MQISVAIPANQKLVYHPEVSFGWLVKLLSPPLPSLLLGDLMLCSCSLKRQEVMLFFSQTLVRETLFILHITLSFQQKEESKKEVVRMKEVVK